MKYDRLSMQHIQKRHLMPEAIPQTVYNVSFIERKKNKMIENITSLVNFNCSLNFNNAMNNVL